jgi:serine/threonine protein kinase
MLDDRFLILEILSRSGMGAVFKAEDTHNHNQLVAVKVPHPECESDPDFISRFQRPLRAVGWGQLSCRR